MSAQTQSRGRGFSFWDPSPRLSQKQRYDTLLASPEANGKSQNPPAFVVVLFTIFPILLGSPAFPQMDERPLTPSGRRTPTDGLGRRGVLVQQSDSTGPQYDEALRIADVAPLYLLQQFTLGASG